MHAGARPTTSKLARRLATAAVLLSIVFAGTSCSFYFGCTRYTIFEPTPTSPVVTDDSACTSGTTDPPPPVVPEVPMAVLLPLSAVAVGGLALKRQRRSQSTLRQA